MLKEWIRQDTDTFNNCDPTVCYMQYQIEDFINAIENDIEPAVTGEAGRRTVELFSAIYRSTRDNKPVKLPLKPEPGFDGRKIF
jgi:predicted dehydrogenase